MKDDDLKDKVVVVTGGSSGMGRAIAPGPIDTPMLRAADPEGAIADAVPLHRIGTPRELANAVPWPASDAASCVSGCVLTVDGAFLAA